MFPTFPVFQAPRRSGARRFPARGARSRSRAPPGARARPLPLRAGASPGPSGDGAEGGAQVRRAGRAGTRAGAGTAGGQGRNSRPRRAGGGAGAVPGGTGAQPRRPAWTRPHGRWGGCRPVRAPGAGRRRPRGGVRAEPARRRGESREMTLLGSECGKRHRLCYRREQSGPGSAGAPSTGTHRSRHGNSANTGRVLKTGMQFLGKESNTGVVVKSCNFKTVDLKHKNCFLTRHMNMQTPLFLMLN